MAAVTSSRPMHSLPVLQAGDHAEGGLSILQTFQAHIEDMRNLVLCKICIRPLYEPYTLGCGHTYCYSCLTSYFGGASNRRERKNCPDCRAGVIVQPSPNYLLRDLVHMFISRVELLPEDETTAEHDQAKLIEAQLIETDRTARTDGEPSLFKGAFCTSRLRLHSPIRDEEDGVLRCPNCAWEMEDGECGQCGYADHDVGFSDVEDHEGDTIDSRSVISVASSTMDSNIDTEDHAYFNPFLRDQDHAMQNDFREWVRRDQAARGARLARRAVRENESRSRQDRAPTADAYSTDSTMEGGYHDYSEYGADSENEEVPAFVDRRPHNDNRLNADAVETADEGEDEEMTSAMDEEDAESTTSFHRAAILARDQGMNPPFESDLSTNGSEGEGDGETVTNVSNDSDESTESDDESDTPEPTPAVHRLASRPARIVIDTDDEDSSSGEELPPNNNETDDEEEEEESSDDSTPSPPRPAAVRQARVQMHRGHRGGNGRGRPRTRN